MRMLSSQEQVQLRKTMKDVERVYISQMKELRWGQLGICLKCRKITCSKCNKKK